VGNGFSFLQQVRKGDAMSNSQDQNNSSLLWDCFTNWSLTLEKTTQQKTSRKDQKQE
jgi:hypothetical protein